MKSKLSTLACLISLSVFSQPLVRNQLDTNSPPRVTQDLFQTSLYTNAGASVYYLWTNRTLGTWLGIVPGLGLVKSNAIAGVGSLIAGTNGAPNIGGMASVGPGSGVFTNKVTIGSTQIGSDVLSVNGTAKILAGANNYLAIDRNDTSSYARTLFQTAGANRWGVGLRGVDGNNFSIRDENAGVTAFEIVTATGNVGIGTIVPATTLHVSGGNITVSNTTAASQPGLVLKTNSHIGFYAVTASNPPTSGAGTAFIFPATNAAGTAEIFTMDGAGVVKQISEHAMDAPPSMIDDIDPFPNISKEWNDYLGKVRWINRSREATVASGIIKLTANSYEAWLGIQAGANVALLANNNYWNTNRSNWATSAMGTNWYNTMKAFVLFSASQEVVIMTETYDQYNSRLGLTAGSPGFLSVKTWTGVQGKILSDYANGFTNAVAQYNAAVSAGNTNAVAPVWSPPVTQPIPDWLYARGVR